MLLANPIVWAMIGLVAGVYAFIRGFFLLRRKRFILDIPRSTIRGAPLGLVEVSGKVDGPYTIIAPLSGEDCFYYRAMVWQKGSRAPWRRAAEETLATPFFLDDGTGRMLVDPRGAETDLPPVFSEEYESSVPENLRHFLNRHAVSTELPLKLKEFCVRAGDALYVLGTLRQNHPPEGAVKPGGPGTEFLSAEAADLQRRGEIEAILPHDSAPQIHSAHRAESSTNFDLHSPVVLAAANDRPLFISTRTEQEIVQSLALRSAAFIWGGPMLALACFWYLLKWLGFQ